MKRSGIITTLIVVVIGFAWLFLTATENGPLKSLSVGFGLTEQLQKTPLFGGYNMNQLVLFIIFAVIIVVLGAFFFRKAKKN
jgi:hypothetical protein